jgi:hypothetical protein
MAVTNIWWQGQTVHTFRLKSVVESPGFNGIDSPSPLDPPIRPSVDLIDTRYQPAIKFDDLK